MTDNIHSCGPYCTLLTCMEARALELDAARLDAARKQTTLDVAMQTLQQIAITPRNKGARIQARATSLFIQTQIDAAADICQSMEKPE